MTTGQGHAAIRRVRALFDVGTMGSMADPQLLERFLTRNGEVAELAFAALVERHGPMVMRVCRRELGEDDAHDAFQATFLVLVTRAGSLRKRESLGSWLHGVAIRVARCARSASARRLDHERRRAEGAVTEFETKVDDLGPIVREEFDRLPERYRAPIGLCDLDDMTHEEAARLLEWPVGTVKSRLARGRARLRDRLSRRGLAPTILLPWDALCGIPTQMADRVAGAAVRMAARSSMDGVVPASTTALMQGVRRMMIKESIRAWTLASLALGVVAAGFALAAQDPVPKALVPAAKPVLPAARGDEERQISCEVRFVSMDTLGWRKQAGLRLRALGVDGPFTVWTTDAKGLRALLEYCQSRVGSNIVQAPKVTTFEGASATIVNSTTIRLVPAAAEGGKAGVVEEPGGFVATPGKADPGVKQASHSPTGFSDRLNDGVSVQLIGKRLEKGIMVRGSITNSHVVALHDATLPGSDIDPAHPEAAAGGMAVKVPEVVRSKLEGEWLLDDDDRSLVVSLGIQRTVDEKGESQLHEQVVVINTRKILSEREEERVAPRPSNVRPSPSVLDTGKP